MKFVVCPKCLTIASPSKTTPQRVTVCQCKTVALTYTGNGGELAISGPGLLLAFDDHALKEIMDKPEPERKRLALQAFVISRESSTILDLDKSAPPARNMTIIEGGRK